MATTKFNYKDKVSFVLNGETIIGTIYIIDKNGTFEKPGEPSYDILANYQDREWLFKHIPEYLVSKYEA